MLIPYILLIAMYKIRCADFVIISIYIFANPAHGFEYPLYGLIHQMEAF